MSQVGSSPAVVAPRPPRLLDQLRERALARFGRPEPAARHVEWVRRFVLFHGKRHPRELGLGEIGQFLDHLAQSEKDPLRTIEQAREALEFLYQNCLHIPLGDLPDRPGRPRSRVCQHAKPGVQCALVPVSAVARRGASAP